VTEPLQEGQLVYQQIQDSWSTVAGRGQIFLFEKLFTNQFVQ
jgi:hypothetical protein